MIGKIECADKAVESMSSLDLTVLIAEGTLIAMCISSITIILILIARNK